MIEIIVLGNRTLELELRTASSTKRKPKERLLAVYMAYIAFARHHADLFAVMFQSGIDKRPYPDVHQSAAGGLRVAVELAAQIEPSMRSALDLALAIWTMAHGFATLSAEGALRGGDDYLTPVSPEALGRKLLLERTGVEPKQTSRHGKLPVR